jgi:periplasmic protein TonB
MATIFSIFGKSKGLDDIIFRDRNKEYGAYKLRKEEDSSLNKSFLLTFAIISLFCIFLVQSGKRSLVHEVKDTNTVEAVFTAPNLDLPVLSLPNPADLRPPVTRSDFIVPLFVEEPKNLNLEIGPTPDFDDFKGTNGNTSNFGQGTDTEDPVPVETNNWVYFIPEMPIFNGGDLAEFSKWVQKNIIYPQAAIERDLDGKVTAEFIIGKQGKIEEIKILRGVDPLLDNEALRVLKMSPLWTPGKQNGTPVRVKLVLPIVFQLNR